MRSISSAEYAEKHLKSVTSVRKLCASGRISGAAKEKGRWMLPEESLPHETEQRQPELPMGLLERLRLEQDANLPGGIYHKLQVELTYHSNRIEGSALTLEQIRSVFENGTVTSETGETLRVDDLIETINHFRCIDRILEDTESPLTEELICALHRQLKTGTRDSQKDWFAVGAYKRLPNEVGGQSTTPPKRVAREMKRLLASYETGAEHSLEDLLEFHVCFERIHPFQDGNGRVGRLILFRECLRYGIVPFIVDERHKQFYYRGIREWDRMRGYLRDTCLLLQDDFRAVLSYFEIPFEDGD